MEESRQSKVLTRSARLKNISVLGYVGYVRVSTLILRIRAGFIRLFYRSYV